VTRCELRASAQVPHRAGVDPLPGRENKQYLVESVQHGLGVTVLPPMAIHAAAGHVGAIPITAPLHRDLSAVVAAGHPAHRRRPGPTRPARGGLPG
jgi:DNA-binding transcriptional LysR family regulator